MAHAHLTYVYYVRRVVLVALSLTTICMRVCAQLEMQWQMANFDWGKFFDGCVADDFGQYANRLVWVYEFQPDNAAVAKHGYVHVTHKVFYADKGKDGAPEFMPVVLAPPSHQGITPWIVDPAGEQFMLNIPDYKRDPGRETFVSSEMPNAVSSQDATTATQSAKMRGMSAGKRRKKKKDGWGRNRVFTDVFKTAAAHNFPPRVIDEWKALQHMHATYEKSDDLPAVPFNISPPVGEAKTQDATFAIDGQPVPWAELWRVLAFRFQRKHAEQEHCTRNECQAREGHQADSAPPSVGHRQEHGTRPPRAKKSQTQRLSAATLASHNGVTSINHLPAALARAQKVVKQIHNVLASLPDTVSKVEKLQLYFVRTTASEGEFQVGLAQACEGASGDASTTVECKCFVRESWIHGKHHEWGESPMFRVAGDPDQPSKAYKTRERLHDICPVRVECTPKCIKQGQATSKPKIRIQCMRLLRAWCETNGMLNDRPPSTQASGKSATKDTDTADLSNKDAVDSSEEDAVDSNDEDSSSYSSDNEDQLVLASSEEDDPPVDSSEEDTQPMKEKKQREER